MMGMMEQDDQSNQMNYILAAFPVDLSIGGDEHCIAQIHTVRPEESQHGKTFPNIHQLVNWTIWCLERLGLVLDNCRGNGWITPR